KNVVHRKPCQKYLSEIEIVKIKNIPHLSYTIIRIDKNAEDIIKQITEKIIQKKQFTLQLDESTGIFNCAQLMVFVRYINNENEKGINDQIASGKEFDTKTMGEEIFNLLNEQILKHGLSWERCISVYGAVVGQQNSLIARLKTMNSSIKWTRIIHIEILASKQLNEDLNAVLEIAEKTVNLIKSRALNSFFLLLCRDMRSEHITVLLHSNIQWLSCGRLFNHLFEVKAEVAVFLTEIKSELVQYFQDELWICRLASLCDTFDKINNLNLQLQGFNTNILTLHDKVQTFKKKIAFWKNNAWKFVSFQYVPKFSVKNEIILYEHVRTSIKEHLTNLELNFEQYFPNFDADEHRQKLWILNPFNYNAIEKARISEDMKEQLFELSADSVLKMQGMGLGDVAIFLQKMKGEYKQLSNMAFTEFLPFASAYLCEARFLAMTELKTKLRNSMSPENYLIVALSSLKPSLVRIQSRKTEHSQH
uniref:DUF4371 domain-containing protein n=1 Tax=Pelodiscus sinensis TaxID=13735 RepID=K7FHT4_PELSI